MTKVQQALESLKKNQSFKIVVEELERLKNSVERLIFDENTPEKDLKALIIKRNTIKNFIELPDDLITIEKINDVSNTDTNES